jgi:hypothetical protein
MTISPPVTRHRRSASRAHGPQPDLASLARAIRLNIVLASSRGPEALTELIADLGRHAHVATAEGAARASDIVIISDLHAYQQLSANSRERRTHRDTRPQADRSPAGHRWRGLCGRQHPLLRAAGGRAVRKSAVRSSCSRPTIGMRSAEPCRIRAETGLASLAC